MTAISDRYRTNASAFADKITGVPAEGWDGPTPCEDWSVRDLVRHVVDSQGLFLGFIDESLPDDAPSVDDEPAAAFAAATGAVQAALDDPGRAGTEYEGIFGPTSFEDAVDRFLSFDLVVHGWDLAWSTGQDDRIPATELDRIRTTAESFGDSIRAPGAIGPAVEVGGDADEQTRLLAFLGRAREA